MGKAPKIMVGQLDMILSPISTVTYWQNGEMVKREEIRDDQEVVCIEQDNLVVQGRLKPCIAVYVGGTVKRTPIIDTILESLPSQPRSADPNDDPGFWTNGVEILCPSAGECDVVAEFMRDALREIVPGEVITGYHDPFEEGDNGDESTGFDYIRFEV